MLQRVIIPFNKKINLLIVTLVLLFSFGSFSKSTAVTISGIDTDTYAITLNGNTLNEVSGLNITVEIKDSKGKISPGVTFLSNGANALLSSVTTPRANEFLISIALNGKIKDGKATISGKFVENSLSSGAEFNILKVERDGGVNITSLLTAGITFKNSKATPMPTPSPSPTPSSEDSEDETSTSEEEPQEPVSEETQSIVSTFIGENNEEIDLTALSESIDESLTNGELSKDSISLSGSEVFQLKPDKINNYFLKTTAIAKESAIDHDKLRLACSLIIFDMNSDDTSFLGIPQSVSRGILRFNLGFRKGKVSRVTKVIKIPILSTGQVKQLLQNQKPSIDLSLHLFCTPYSIENPEIVQLASEKRMSPKNLTMKELEVFFFHNDIDHITLFARHRVQIQAPKK